MNLLTIEGLTKVYTERKVFDNADFSISTGDKVGIIGVNGTGKSTLLKLVAGLEKPDMGTVTKGGRVVIRALWQNLEFSPADTVLKAVLKGNITTENEWTVESEAKSLLNRLQITDFEQPIRELSGGQKKRVALVSVLLQPADILILDEPTNHLDNIMADWLEEFLIKYRGAILMVTHDRYFLDRVSNRIIEISKGKIYNYAGQYSEFLRLKEARQNIEIASERKRQSLLRTELEWLARGARARATKQKAHIERIEKMQEQSAPEAAAVVEMSSISARMGKKTLEVRSLSKEYGDKKLFAEFDYIFLKNDRIGIIGVNGCGKSTLLKILTGKETADTGEIEIGSTIKIGYFSQESEEMDENQRVIDYVKEVGEYVETAGGAVTAAQMLERFLFDGVMQWSLIGKLSGGERRRLHLLRVLMAAPNILILDEPTNDLDIQILTVLEDYLDSFEGIVLTVSHDRYFLDRIVSRIFAFEDNYHIQQYEGGYSDYLAAYEVRHPKAEVSNSETKNFPAKENKKQKMQGKLKFSYKEEREYAVIDEEIEQLEALIVIKDDEIAKESTNYGKLTELMSEKTTLEGQLEEKLERWEYLNELAERIEREKADS